MSFREFLTSPNYCGVTPSPFVAAIVDASEGRTPTTIDAMTCERHFGCVPDSLPSKPSRVVVLSAGGRGGKTSRLLAPKTLHAAWTVPAPDLSHGEEAFAIIVAPTTSLARQAYEFCRGYVSQSPVLRAALVGEPLAESFALRRPDGRIVRVQIFAASRGGTQLRSRTLVFAGFDEAALFRADGSGEVNDVELYHAVFPRVVEGGGVWLVSTPWIAGSGLMESKIAQNFGTHTDALVVHRVPTKLLRPTWDATGEIERAERADDPDRAAREIDAVPLSESSAAFFSPAAIEAAVDPSRPFELSPDKAAFYAAGGDTGFRRNSSALAIVQAGARVRLAILRELRPEPGMPLKPAGVVDAFAVDLSRYGCGSLTVDSHERDEVNLELSRYGLSAAPAPEGQRGKASSFMLTRKLLHEGRLDLPNHPRLLRQLRDVVAKPMPGGGLSIQSPVRKDGSHGDLVSALVNAVWAAASEGLREPDGEADLGDGFGMDYR